MDRELILTVHVQCLEALTIKGHTKDIVMIPFSGTAESPYFSGRVAGTGTDTQRISGGVCLLSARYILEGEDMTGAHCRIFIENESRPDGTLVPAIVTDSEALAEWETASLRSEIEPVPEGVTVRIFRDI